MLRRPGFRKRRRSYKPKPARKLTDSVLDESITSLRQTITTDNERAAQSRLAGDSLAAAIEQASERKRQLEAEIEKLKASPESKHGPLSSLLQGSRIRPEVRSTITALRSEIAGLDRQLEGKKRGLTLFRNPWAEQNVKRLELLQTERQRRADRAKRESDAESSRVAKERMRQSKMEELRAAAAQNSKKARQVASTTRKRLEKHGTCPYCAQTIVGGGHADHIYPLSKGGRSVRTNMVVVCAACNVNKRDLTLREFIKAQGLGRDEVEQRLDGWASGSESPRAVTATIRRRSEFDAALHRPHSDAPCKFLNAGCD